jgi:hypothetical protein
MTGLGRDSHPFKGTPHLGILFAMNFHFPRPAPFLFSSPHRSLKPRHYMSVIPRWCAWSTAVCHHFLTCLSEGVKIGKFCFCHDQSLHKLPRTCLIFEMFQSRIAFLMASDARSFVSHRYWWHSWRWTRDH